MTSLRSVLLYPFYRVERRLSREQLRLDFGEFPPTPLQCESPQGEFNVLRTRALGDVYYECMVIRRFMHSVETGQQAVSSEFLELVGAETQLALRRTFEGLQQFPKFISLLLIGFVLTVTGIKALAGRLLRKDARPKRLGSYTPALSDESNVIVRIGRLANHRVEAVIAHEHIHVLQHRSREQHRRHLRDPKSILSEKDERIPFTHYLFEKREVEARLHEAVLSFYREFRRLPLTVSGFLGLLASSQRFGWLAGATMKLQGIDFKEEAEPFADREDMFLKQLEEILLAIKSEELLSRFMTEVLSVMYGNLLKYYGDDAASLAFHQQIPRPNWYDDLYGESCSQAA